MQIEFEIDGMRLTRTSDAYLIEGSENFIECVFAFSSDWDELDKWALFKRDNNTYEIFIENNKCLVPIQCTSTEGEFTVSVVGRKNAENITGTASDKLLTVRGSEFVGGMGEEGRLTETYLVKVLAEVKALHEKTATSEANAAQSAKESADSAAVALQSEKNAKASEKAAETSKDAAAQSEANSKTSEDAARGYADDAEASKGAAAALAVQAAASANAAAESAKQATESEKKSAQSETNAKLSETNSKLSETNSQNSALESAQSAVNAEKSNKSAEKHSNDAGASADNAELSAQQVTELAEQVNRDAMQVASDTKSVTELTGQAVKAAGNAQTSMEQAGQIKTDTQTIADNASQAMAEVIAKAKTDIDAQGTEIITQATAQADRAQSAADGIRDTADTLQADNEHLKADLKHANRRISVLYDLGKGITHRYETDSDVAYSKDVPSGAKVMDVKLIGGKSVVGNNIMQVKSIDKTDTGVYVKTNVDSGAVTINGVQAEDRPLAIVLADSIPVHANHSYFMRGAKTITITFRPKEDIATASISWKQTNDKDAINVGVMPAGMKYCVVGIFAYMSNAGKRYDETFYPQLIDLTQMFGAGNEPTLEQCREIFASESYPYNAGTLMSADVTAVQVGDKVIQLPNTISLKSAGSVYDSLEFYEQDGKYYQKHTQRVGVVDLGSLPTDNWFRRPTSYRWGILNWTSDASKSVFGGIRNILCSAYNAKRITDVYSKNTSIGICVNNSYSSATPSIDIDDDRYENLNDFVASLPGVLLYYELATPIVTVTEVDNRFDAVDCKAGDKITFVGNSDYHLPVPNEEEYLIALNEVTA